MSNTYTPVPGIPEELRNYMRENGKRGGKTVTPAKLKALAGVRRRKREIRLQRLRAGKTAIAASTGTERASKLV